MPVAFTLITIGFILGCAGVCYFAAVLTDRAFHWNDLRRERATRYRGRK